MSSIVLAYLISTFCTVLPIDVKTITQTIKYLLSKISVSQSYISPFAKEHGIKRISLPPTANGRGASPKEGSGTGMERSPP